MVAQLVEAEIAARGDVQSLGQQIVRKTPEPASPESGGGAPHSVEGRVTVGVVVEPGCRPVLMAKEGKPLEEPSSRHKKRKTLSSKKIYFCPSFPPSGYARVSKSDKFQAISKF
jgi:hypothetical protein